MKWFPAKRDRLPLFSWTMALAFAILAKLDPRIWSNFLFIGYYIGAAMQEYRVIGWRNITEQAMDISGELLKRQKEVSAMIANLEARIKN